MTDLRVEGKVGPTMDEPAQRPRRAPGAPSHSGEPPQPAPAPAPARRGGRDTASFERPFLSALTDTIDLSALRQRLALEGKGADEWGRVGYGPPPPSRSRGGTADGDSTQVLPRSTADGDSSTRVLPRSTADGDSTQVLPRSTADGDSTQVLPRSTVARTRPPGPGVLRPPDAPRRPPEAPGEVDRTVVLRPGGPPAPPARPAPPAGRRRAGRRAPPPAPPPVGGGGEVGEEEDEDAFGLSNLAADEQTGRHRVQPPATSGRSKAVWTLVDQVLSSGTNTLIGVIVARSVSKTEFGAFSIAFTLFALFIGLSRAGATSVLGIRYATAAPRLFRSAAAAATGAGFVAGLATGCCVVVAGAAIGGVVGESLVAIGILFPGLLLQDAWRYVFFAEGKPSAAAANDLLWAVVQLGAVFILVARDVSSSSAMLLAWGGAAAVAAFVGVAQAGFWPAPERCRDWLAEHRNITGYLSLEYIAVQGAQQASTLLIGVLAAIHVVGALRGVQILLGPTTVLAVGVVSFAIPEFSRRTDMSPAARLRAAQLLSAVVVGAGLIWGLLFLLLPSSLGQAVLGETWDGAQDILALTIVQQAGAAATVGPACMLYALGRAKMTFRVNLAFAPQLIIWPIIGLQLWGARGAVVGYIVTFWVMVPVWFHILRRAVREHAEEDAEEQYAEDAVQGGPGGERAYGGEWDGTERTSQDTVALGTVAWGGRVGPPVHGRRTGPGRKRLP